MAVSSDSGFYHSPTALKRTRMPKDCCYQVRQICVEVILHTDMMCWGHRASKEDFPQQTDTLSEIGVPATKVLADCVSMYQAEYTCRHLHEFCLSHFIEFAWISQVYLGHQSMVKDLNLLYQMNLEALQSRQLGILPAERFGVDVHLCWLSTPALGSFSTNTSTVLMVQYCWHLDSTKNQWKHF